MSVSRVCIQTDRDGDPVAVDVALPSSAVLAELLPAIVELVDDRVPPGNAARGWRLERPAGGRLEEALSLIDNGVRDGELLILHADHAPTLGPIRRTACQEASVARPRAFNLGENLPGAVCGISAILAAAMLAWTAGSDGATSHAIIAAVGAAAAAATTVAGGYATASNIAAVALTCATGFLAVPSGPAAPNVFLAAIAACSASLLLLRLSGRPSPALTATATLSLLTAVVTLVAMPVVMLGAALSIASLALLTGAPRLSVLATGLGRDHGHADAADRAVACHAILSGLVAGCAGGAASGAVVVAAACQTGATPAFGAIAFTVLIGTVLLLRARTYVDPDRQIAMIAGGLASTLAGIQIGLSGHQEGIAPVACALVVLGLIAVRRPGCGAAASRMVVLLEYGALAAVVPVACWAVGADAIVGGFHLP